MVKPLLGKYNCFERDESMSRNLSQETEENHTILAMIAGNIAEIRAGYISNTGIECNRYSKLLTRSFVMYVFCVKRKRCSASRHGGAWGERRYSSYSFSTSALDGSEWSASRPVRALPPGKGPPIPIG
jgi:hypothetical protein